MAAQRPITPAELTEALGGQNPPLGHPISQAELGRRLAPHRQGRYPGRPFTQAAISLYLAHPDQQSDDFAHAFRSWRITETQRQTELRLVADGLTVDELLQESAGRVIQLGDGPASALLVIGRLPPGVLIDPHAPIPSTILCRAEIAVCPCGQRFVKRTPRHRYCSPACPARNTQNEFQNSPKIHPQTP